MSVYVYEDNNDLCKFHDMRQRFFPMLPRCGGGGGGDGRGVPFHLSPGSRQVRRHGSQLTSFLVTKQDGSYNAHSLSLQDTA